MTIKEIIEKSDKKTSLVLLSIPVILTIYLYYGKHPFFEKCFNVFSSAPLFDMHSHMYEYFMAFILLFIIPLVFIKYVFKDNLKNYGLGFGDLKFGLKFTAIAVVILVPFLLAGTFMPNMQSTYPEARSVIGKLKLLLLIELFYMLYYIGWEFFFRGYVLFGLREKLGDLAAILIQTIPSCLMHIGKPGVEIFGSILAGIAFGYLAIRTRSMFYPFIIHLFIGVFTDLVIWTRLT